MKKIIFCFITLIIWQVFLFSASLQLPNEPKMLDTSVIQNSGSIQLKLTNFGSSGYDQNSNLIFPPNSGANYLYRNAIWIGGKKYRRNLAGQQLYWVSEHPGPGNDQTITETDPAWNPNLHPVIDTLTTVGFDGDIDLYELLPAYNPLLSSNTSVTALYDQFNSHDKVLKSILSNPMPRPFAYPDPEGNYCFTLPQQLTGNEPAFETCSAYYYDFCPFGTTGDRDWGNSSNSNIHIPLGLAIEQKSYAWPLQNLDRMVIFKYTLHNVSQVDTLFDLALSSYMDCDIGLDTSVDNGTDDISGYVMGEDYEFAYSRDGDFDSGLVPAYIACKLYLPNSNLNISCYNWKVGDGPDDSNPQSLNHGSRLTANEKYWLQTGRNPTPGSLTKYANLRGGPLGNVLEYEQPYANDTRFLYSLFGALPTATNPEPNNRLNLAPGQSLTFYMAIFTGFSIDELKAQSIIINDFINNCFSLGDLTGLTSIPYITSIHQTAAGCVEVNWFSYTDSDHFELMFKPSQEPNSQWQTISCAGNIRTCQVSGLTNLLNYQFKITSIYPGSPTPIYLESLINEFLIDDNSSAQDETTIPILLSNYPNPCNGKSGTVFCFDPKQVQNASLTIYNILGQKVRVFGKDDINQSRGNIVWNGKDDNGKPVASGVYFYILKSKTGKASGKLLLLK
ncbi:MAG TPA: T9SS type A sorting domain-containing protein [Candidatus Cloacimonadota bacterium]|nr:T9SS type A sorting domain-containing protein [Candidatus Cloacimonadota bacterium]HOV17127.1 T9SS type A sorting domain-containing protein [Candidatus Cloacimonadota bacterium]HQL15419.1 T9SS type A sorting domain-containing protein [Candidatus Cloacimonadota bacterium]